MMLEPIHQQRVLPTQMTQQYLPPITVDTTEVHKMIDKMYNKRIVLPETQIYEVTNYIDTPQGLIPQPSLTPQVVSQTQVSQIPKKPKVSQISLIQPQILVPQPQLIALKPTRTLSIASQSLLLQPILPQSMVLQLINPKIINLQPLVRQSVALRPLSVSLNPSLLRRTIEY